MTRGIRTASSAQENKNWRGGNVSYEKAGGESANSWNEERKEIKKLREGKS